MSLAINTFSNTTNSGSVFFKAVGHPLSVEPIHKLINELATTKKLAIYDPQNTLVTFASLYPSSISTLSTVYVQDASYCNKDTLGFTTLPITKLEKDTELLFIPAFDTERIEKQIQHIVMGKCKVTTLDTVRLPDRFLADTQHYLNPLNFATNLLFFREQSDIHTRLVTANYWSAYGAKKPFVWGRLFDAEGTLVLDFEKPLGDANEIFCLDSAELKKEYNLPDFCGQIFVHIVGAAGHDIVKYIVDIYNDDSAPTFSLSCTHDANSWPADLYAGIPAAGEGDTIILWVQNSHPTPIAANTIGIKRIGENKPLLLYSEPISPFATRAINLGKLAPQYQWPEQLEIYAGKHFVRPRYEVINKAGHRRINHANVERTDLVNDPQLPNLSALLGKGYILPAPILPRAEYLSECLPTPMSTSQHNLPLTATAYNSQGEKIGRQFLGCLPRNHQALLNLSELAIKLDDNEAGHIELTYDFQDGGAGDGWLHSLFRYTLKSSQHTAETSFGAHMFNHLITYKNEPQSYKGPPPGLSTRLFLRIALAPIKTLCHLSYPVGVQWHPISDTYLELKNRYGQSITEQIVNIPANGSYYFCCQDIFTAEQLKKAGNFAYIIIRDTTCRLFGYHGARLGDTFAFDHMFGF